MLVIEAMEHLRELAPEEYAASWDNVGLQVGDEGAEITGILVTLDVDQRVVEEADSLGAGLIVSHHPLIFQPLHRIDLNKTVARTIKALLCRGISLYVAHTNLDVVEGGVSAELAESLGLREVRPLARMTLARRVKLVTFVPPGSADEVREALCRGGAGRIGRYECCAFQSVGEGTFRPLEGASPAVGEVGVLNREPEIRLEIILDREDLPAALEELRRVHPYEEPAVDLYPLEDVQAGLGRVGTLPRTMTLKELGDLCRERLGARGLRFVGDAGKTLSRVAVCGGSGEEVIEAAAGQADALVTGDIKYHAALRALDLGLHVIDAGHAATERVVLPRLASFLRERLREKGVRVWVSCEKTDPWGSEG